MPLRRSMVCLIAVSVLACAEAAAQVAPISPETLLSSPPAGALILDVRTAEEYAAGHVPGAVHLPYDEVAGRLAELGEPTRTVVVYCESGRRAGRAESVLLEAGFSDVRHLAGDMRGWRAAGRATE